MPQLRPAESMLRVNAMCNGEIFAPRDAAPTVAAADSADAAAAEPARSANVLGNVLRCLSAPSAAPSSGAIGASPPPSPPAGG